MRSHIVQIGKTNRVFHFSVMVLLALLIGFSGSIRAASKNEQASRYYEDALVRYEKKDFAGAIIQLKNALQQDANMLAAHVLLGRSFLEKGQPNSAEVEFDKSLKLGVDRAEIAIARAQAYAYQGKYRRLLDAVALDGLTPIVHQAVLSIRANAQMELGDLQAARQTLEQAYAITGTKPPHLILIDANLSFREGKPQVARNLINQAINLDPKSAPYWNFRATISHSENNFKAALSDYDKALALDPKYLAARLARVSLLMDMAQDKKAELDLQYLQREFPEDPRGLYLGALLSDRRHDSAAAKKALHDLTKVLDPISPEVLDQSSQLLLLGGLAHFSLNQMEQAASYLKRLLALAPEHIAGRKLMGALRLKEGNSNAAIEVLTPVVSATPDDANALSLLASAYVAKKDFRKASALLERATQVTGGAPQFESSLGFSLLGGGQVNQGLEHLTRAFLKDPGQPQVGAALAILHIKRGQPRQAVQVAEAMTRLEPNSPLALNLLGVARVAANDRAGGRAAYDKAVTADHRFIPARLNLAKLDVMEGKFDAARERLAMILKEQPNNTQAMSELANVEENLGRLDAAILQLQRIHSLEPKNISPGVHLAEIYLRKGEAEKALNLAKDLESANSTDLEVLAIEGRAYVAVGNPGLARVIYKRMTLMAGFDSAWQYRIAQLQLGAGDQNAAQYNLDKALSGNPEYLPALALQTELELKAGKLSEAEARARRIVSRYPGQGEGYRLLGNIAVARGRLDEAMTHFRTALDKEPGTDAAIRLYQASIQAGRQAHATEIMTGWLKAHPNDDAARLALAEGHLRTGNIVAARAVYETILKRRGETVGILNNLAGILLQQGEAAALDYAERAYRLAPSDAAVADTLGWVLVRQGQAEKGLRYLREAKLRNSSNAEIRYHLAAALERLGRPAEARQELDQALTGNTSFPGIEDAKKLHQRLPFPAIR